MKSGIVLCISFLAGVAAIVTMFSNPKSPLPPTASPPGELTRTIPPPALEPIPAFVGRGLGWLVEAQQQNGGFGAGSHAHQDQRNPHQLPTDPGTSAFVGQALLRAGHSPFFGDHQAVVKRVAEHLLDVVEKSPEDGPRITEIDGTQLQAKMGKYVDTALCAGFFTRLLPAAKQDAALEKRVTAALDKCIRKIQRSQDSNGGWSAAGWAGGLQNSLMNLTLETAAAAGRPVDRDVLARSQKWHQSQVDEKSGTISSGIRAGVTLYTTAGNVRANATKAKEAQVLIEGAKKDGRLAPDRELDTKALEDAGVKPAEAAGYAKAVAQVETTNRALSDERTLAGFGNNGGEEFLSYMLASESKVISGADEWNKWRASMNERLAKIQNNDGSWSGHHCITSPVFCTAAVILTMTADRDAGILAAAATKAPAPK